MAAARDVRFALRRIVAPLCQPGRKARRADSCGVRSTSAKIACRRAGAAIH